MPGTDGPAGPQGPAGEGGLEGVYVLSNSSGNPNSSPTRAASVSCDSGDIAIGGGGFLTGQDNEVALQFVGPANGSSITAPTSWRAFARELDGINGDRWAITVTVVCASAPAP